MSNGGASVNPTRELLLRRDDINIRSIVGRGSFGAVYLGDYLGARVAVKKLNEFAQDEDVLECIQREMEISLCKFKIDNYFSNLVVNNVVESFMLSERNLKQFSLILISFY